MRLVYGGGGWGFGWGYEISCVLSREGDVGAWVLLCRPKAGTIVPDSCVRQLINPIIVRSPSLILLITTSRDS